jgi:hypothetical protein
VWERYLELTAAFLSRVQKLELQNLMMADFEESLSRNSKLKTGKIYF